MHLVNSSFLCSLSNTNILLWNFPVQQICDLHSSDVSSALEEREKKSKCQIWKSLFWMCTGIGRKNLHSVFFFHCHWGYNWMRHFVLQRTAGNNCLSPPPPYNKINNRLWSLVCFSFHQIPFVCYWGLATWVGELKSEVGHVVTIPPNVSLLPVTEEKGKRRVYYDEFIREIFNTLYQCLSNMSLVVQTGRDAWAWLMWPWSCAAALFSQPSSGREWVLKRRLLHSNNQASPQRAAGWSKVCLQSGRGSVVRKRWPVSGPHHWDRRGLCSAGHQLAGVSPPLSAAWYGKGVKQTVIDGVVPHCTWLN